MANKITFVLGVSLLCAQSAHASQKQNLQELIALERQALVQPQQPLLNQSGGISQYFGDTFNGVMATGYTLFTTNANSLMTTVTNQVSDAAAFAKLGYPPTDPVNKAELLKFIAIKNRHETAIANGQWNSEEFKSDVAYMTRRQGYCSRLVNAVPTHFDGAELALFALENYLSVMSSFEAARLAAFVKSKEIHGQNLGAQLNQLVESNVNNTNSLVRSLVQSNVAAVYNELNQEQEEKGDQQEEKENKE